MKKLLLPALLLLGITLSGNPQAYVDNWLNPAPYDNWRSPAPTDSSRYIKVMTFNILHGATTRGDFDLDAIARVKLYCQSGVLSAAEM
jgi:hypothetical protein